MSESIPLIRHWNDVRQAIREQTAPDLEPFPDWEESWVPHLRPAAEAEQGARIGPKGLAHALALTKLYCEQPVEEVRAEVAKLRAACADPAAVASEIVAGIARQAYGQPDERPSQAEWARNRMLRTLAAKIGGQYQLECLHAWAREAANKPAHRAHQDRGFVFSCFLPPEEGPLTAGKVLQQTVGADEEVQTRLGPKMLMLLVRGLKPLAEDEERLGMATVAVMHYGQARFFSPQGIADVMDLVVEIESA